MKCNRVPKPSAQHKCSGRAALPPDPRDLRVVQARALAWAGNPRPRVTGRLQPQAQNRPRPLAARTRPEGIQLPACPYASESA
jgi:hypothetical protein